MPNRIEFLNDLIGRPWQANAKGPEAFDCWHLCRYVLSELFKKEVPTVEVPESPTWPWMIQTFREHAELGNWKELKGMVTIPDGAICLMARHESPAHCGIFFRDELSVLHCDQRAGVVFQNLIDIRSEGWAKLRFFVPA